MNSTLDIYYKQVSAIRQKLEREWSSVAIAELRALQKRVVKECCSRERELVSLIGESEEAFFVLLRASAIKPINGEMPKELDAKVLALAGKGNYTTEDLCILSLSFLFRKPHYTPLLPVGLVYPSWFLKRYVTFLLETPPFFALVGESVVYTDFQVAAFKWLKGYVATVGDLTQKQALLNHIVCSINMAMSYASARNLKSQQKLRAEFIEELLELKGHVLDWSPGPRPRRSRVRIGFLAGHYSHQTETYAFQPFYRSLSKDRFEVILYTTAVFGDDLEKECFSYADRVCVLDRNDISGAVAGIRKDELDVLVVGTNISAVSNHVAQIAAHRLAPIQCNTKMSPSSSGFRNMDYILTTTNTEPREDPQNHYTEKLLFMPSTPPSFRFGAEPETYVKHTRKSLGIAPDKVVFFNSATTFKVTPELILHWFEIIRQTPNSVLLLAPFNPNWASNYPISEYVMFFLGMVKASGLGLDRFKFIFPPTNRWTIQSAIACSDVYLESFPYTSSTSMTDPLAVGCPMVVFEGYANAVERWAGEQLRWNGLERMVACSTDEYIRRAVALGTDPKLREEERRMVNEIRAKGFPSADDKLVADGMAECLKGLLTAGN